MGSSREIPLDSSNYFIPVSVLCDRKIALFETMVEYLKDQKGLTYHEIAKITNRDDRTIWTVYNRAKKKRNPEYTTKHNSRKKIIEVARK